MSRNAFESCAREIEEREDERNNLRMERESMKANNKELAFPNSSRADGMSLRDYLAAKAMQSLIECAWERNGDTNYICDNDGRLSLHLRAYEHADAMIKARDQ